MKKELLFLISALFSLSLIAQPTINNTTGVVQHKQTVTINGSGFVGNVSLKLFDEVTNIPSYTGLTEGDPIPTVSPNPWSSAYSGNYGGDVPRITYSNANYPHRHAHSDGHYYALGKKFIIGWPRALGGGSPPSSQTQLYVTWWYKPNQDPNSEGGSNKFIRIWDRNGGTRAHVTWTQEQLFGTDYKISTPNDPNSGLMGWTNGWGTGKVGEWNRMEILADAKNHLIEAYINGKKIKTSNSSIPGEFTIDYFGQADPNRGFNIAALGFDHGMSAYANLITQISEIYASISPARVELGNASTWSAITHKEIQIPTSWTTTSIDFSVNQGIFSDCEQVYLYVVDKDGKVNQNGYPVTFAGSGCITGVEKKMEASIQVYPNPTLGELNIEGISSTDKITLTMKNMLGEEVKVNRERFSNKIKVNTEHLPTGVYLLNITYNKQESVYKIIKQD